MSLSITGTTKLLGLLGNGISYSLSPAIHNFSAHLLGIDQVYVPIDVPSSDLASIVKSLWSMGYVGFNVTQPFKTAVVPLLAKATGTSINTVSRGKLGFEGTSTDGVGFQNAVARLGCDLPNFSEIIFIGGGGATTGILAHLESLPFKGQIKVLARQTFPPIFQNLKISHHPLTSTLLEQELRNKKENCLLIQATSAPHRGDNMQNLCEAMRDFKGVVVDLCYGKVSNVLKAAQAAQLKAQDGIPMLIEQARAAQEIWWGKAAPFEKILAALRL